VPTYQEVKLGRSSGKETAIGFVVGATLAVGVIWFVTALVLSLA
jgi:hypothetical protein